MHASLTELPAVSFFYSDIGDILAQKKTGMMRACSL